MKAYVNSLSVAALTTISLIGTTAQAVTFSLLPSSGQDLISVGDPVTVDLQVSDLGQNTAPSLGAYNLDLNFQSANITLTPDGLTLGDQQLQLNNTNSINNLGEFDASAANANGQLNLSEISLNAPAILNAQQADNFTLATLNFTAAEAGQTPVNLGIIQLADADGQALTADNASIALFIARDLKAIPDLTPLQVNTGQTLQRICQQSINGTISQSQLTSLACNVDTAALENPKQLASTLQNVAAEETFVPAAMATRTTLGLLTTLEQQLRARRHGSRGLNEEQTSFRKNGQLLSQADLGLSGARGGSAGEDDSAIGLSERLGGFLKASANFGETDSTRREDGFDFNKEEVILGMDYQFSEQLVAGLALGYSYYNANFHRSSLVAGGDTDSNAYMASLYTTYYLGNFYVDGIFAYTHSDYDMTRRIISTPDNLNTTAYASPESNQYAGSLNFGYEHNQGSLTYGPFARIAYLNQELDSYQESEATEGFNHSFDEQEVESLETVLGAQVSYAFSQSFGVIIPQFRAEWHHEFLENAQTITARLANTPITYRSNGPDRDFANLSVGVSGVFHGGLQAFMTYETILAQSNVESHAFSLGVRLAF